MSLTSRPAAPKTTPRRDRPATRRPGFAAFAAGVRRDLSPSTRLEAVLADRVALAAWRLHVLSADESDAALDGDPLPPISRAHLRAECSLETALSLLQSARQGRAPRWGHATHPASPVPHFEEAADALLDASEADLSNECPTLPDRTEAADEPGDDLDDEPVPARWQDRLVFDLNVSESSPVVKGTWVTVSEVVSRIVDGWTWADVLRTHPELTEDDVRTCLAYTVEQDNRGEV